MHLLRASWSETREQEVRILQKTCKLLELKVQAANEHWVVEEIKQEVKKKRLR